MNNLIDVVNFNADASCLPSDKWIDILKGGKESHFYKWLELYVSLKKKINLGIVGSSICDINYYCPEAIDLIESNKSIFNILIRPFSHDNSLIRTRDAFRINLDYGVKVAKKFFSNTSSSFLPPEFMLLSEHIPILEDFNFSSVLVNPSRLPEYMSIKIPEVPFLVRGINSSSLACFPVAGKFTKEYLNSIHNYDFIRMNQLISNKNNQILWRDGESVFLVPDGVNREKRWLEAETAKRSWLDDLNNINLKDDNFYTYPAHSFLAWMEEFKMFGYVNRINSLERDLMNFDIEQTLLWFQAINSDVLSSIEKKDVSINIKSNPNSKNNNFTITRTHRAFEGEEFLYFLEESILGNREYLIKFLKELSPHAKKYISRYSVIKELD
jgi:hypothetical protein